MFRPPNPFEEIVNQATDENLEDSDWGLNLQLCDKVSEEGETGARNAIQALLKRLAHRNPNVQTNVLEVTNTLSENCGLEVHREISSKSFTDGLDRVLVERTTNDKVKKKVLLLIKKWAEQFVELENVGPEMGELYETLRKNPEYYPLLQDGGDPSHDPEEIARLRAEAEEEELRKVIQLSIEDKGGRWGGYETRSNNVNNGTGGSSGSGAGGSSSQVLAPGGSSSGYQQQQQQQPVSQAQAQPRTTSMYAAGRPSTQAPPYHHVALQPQPVAEPPPPSPQDPDKITRVKALYDYAPETPNELAFSTGDTIKVLGRTYPEWWRGTVRGRVGIFPVNYVEAVSDTTLSDLKKRVEEEDAMLQSLARFDELLERLKGVDITRGERAAEGQEIETLYRSSVEMQAKIDAMLQRHADEQAELQTMASLFVQSRQKYEEMTHTAQPHPQYAAQQYGHGQVPNQRTASPSQSFTAAGQQRPITPQPLQQQQHQQQQQPYSQAQASGTDPTAQQQPVIDQAELRKQWDVYNAYMAEQQRQLQQQQQQHPSTDVQPGQVMPHQHVQQYSSSPQHGDAPGYSIA